MSSLQSFQSSTSLLLTVALLFLAYLATLVIYRIYFHPLAKPQTPGLPKMPRSIWLAQVSYSVFDIANRLGPVFRYGPNRLSFNTSTALHTIYTPKANIRKSDFYKILISPAGPSILAAIPNDMHARKKRVLSQAFSEKALRSIEEYMLLHTREFCEKLSSSPEPVNMSHWSTYLTGDVLGEVCFGQSFSMLKEKTNRKLIGLITRSARFGLITSIGTYANQYHLQCGSTIPLQHTPIPRIFFSKMLAGRLKFREWALARAGERTKLKDSGRKDFYHYMMEAKNPSTDEKLDHKELWSEASNLIVAGVDTTATTLAATFFYLTRNRYALEKAKKEVREAFEGCGVEDIKTGEKLKGCKYLRACLDESLRMTPPVPGMLPRTVLPGGIEIDNYQIPAGVEVGVAAYAIHHNERYYEDSFTYRPERWLEDEKGMGEAFAPFSHGPRACIGKNMAYMEMMNTMARVLWLFDMRGVGELGESGERKGEFEVRDCFICDKDGPMVEFSKA
ncbi:related to cytochrome P450 67 [Phialocephala subalpina]|uniref:Related to cytochrome P450 67 n=1 Tax=Phialocephala subalpina TaxID=576137 RepID=A0A1L7X7P2_9HELO|nr:related to cytochrome P450 67 [Phialocephala subalpina]